jgi:microcystin-dependent protein
MNTLRQSAALGRISLPLLLSLALCAPLARGSGNPPARMTYQGYLVDGNGNVLGSTNTGPQNYDVIFRIWNDQAATATANREWTEQQTVTVDKGYFSVLLGEGSAYNNEPNPPLSSVFTNSIDVSGRYLEITVKGIGPGGGDSTIMPRLQLVTAPFAFLAQNAVNAFSLVNSTNGQVMVVTGSNVGIGKSNPNSALDVNGTVTGTGLTVNGSASASTLSVSGSASAGSLNVSGSASFGNTTVNGAITVNNNSSFNGDVKLGGNLTVNNNANVNGNATLGTTTVNGSGLTVNGPASAKSFSGNGTIPIGGIIMWAGAINAIPAGWALCNGQVVSGLATPNLTDRFVVGAGNSYAPNNTGGSASVTLSTANLPSHAHAYDDGYYIEAFGGGINGNDYVAGANGSGVAGSGGTDYDNHYIYTRNMVTSYTGSNSPFNVTPPYYALAYIMRFQ